MRDLICDTITSCVLNCDMGKINASNEIMSVNQRKRENMETKRNFYINLHLKDLLDIEFTAC